MKIFLRLQTLAASPRGIFLYLLAGIFLIILTRIPMLTSPFLDADGDEAILGLMAKHVSEGKEFPIFFYGQRYGLSFIETSVAAVFFLISGPSTISLKLSMLFLWISGWMFFVLALDVLSHRKYAFIAGLLLIFCPAWSLWSMMARGGYLTAFALFSFCLWIFGLVYQKKASEKEMSWILGLAMALLLLSQPLFFLAFLPFFFLLGRKGIFFYAAFFFSFSSILALFYFLSRGASNYWDPKLFSWQDASNTLLVLSENLWSFFSGVYYLSDTEAFRGFFTILSAYLWCFFAALMPLAMLFFFRKNKMSLLLCIPFFSAFGILLVSIFLFPFGCRYLLPLPFLMLFFFSQAMLEIPQLPWLKKGLCVLLVLSLFSGSGALWDARRYSRTWNLTWDSPYVKGKQELIETLLKKEIHHVYCLHPLFQWNILWDSQEKILARFYYAQDRYPLYPKAVDDALRNDKKVALVGRDFQISYLLPFYYKLGLRSVPIEMLPSGYFWIYPVEPRILQQLGFQSTYGKF